MFTAASSGWSSLTTMPAMVAWNHKVDEAASGLIVTMVSAWSRRWKWLLPSHSISSILASTIQCSTSTGQSEHIYEIHVGVFISWREIFNHKQWSSLQITFTMVQMHGNHYVAGLEPRLVPLSKALYHTCFICGHRCKRWSRRPKLTSSVISDVKPIIYIYILLEYQPFSFNLRQ